MEEYDVIIAGAGPAGGNCAKDISKKGYNVLLLESSKNIGEPNFSTAGTPNETLEVFNLPKKVTDSPWSSILIAGPNERTEFVYKKRMGYVLNYKKLKQHLSGEAKKHGADVLTSSIVKSPIVKGARVVGVTVNVGGENKKFYSKIVIDATGGRSTLAKQLGLAITKDSITEAIEYHMKNIDFERRGRLEFYGGRNIAPGGYAWIFPKSMKSAKVGIGTFFPLDTTKSLKNRLDVFSSKNAQTKNAEVTEFHGGSMYSNGGIREHATNGFLVIGDAAFQINPLAAEGVRHALYAGKFAAETIEAALQINNASKKQLQKYNEKWGNYVGDKWKISYIIQKIIYSFTDKQWDNAVKTSSEINSDDFFQLAFYYRYELLKKYKYKVLKFLPKYFFL
jgi:digeranylgeranylglycerophospholipid reductase